MGRDQRDEPVKAALTTALTPITLADTNGADYALSTVTTTTPYGFAVQNEATAFIFVVQNNQKRIAELEAAIEALKIVPEN